MPQRKKTDAQVVDPLADDLTFEPASSDVAREDTGEDAGEDTGPAGPPPVEEPQTRPVPDSQLTAEQRRIRDLENQLALERGRKDPEPEFEPKVNDAEGIHIHCTVGLPTLNVPEMRRTSARVLNRCRTRSSYRGPGRGHSSAFTSW